MHAVTRHVRVFWARAWAMVTSPRNRIPVRAHFALFRIPSRSEGLHYRSCEIQVSDLDRRRRRGRARGVAARVPVEGEVPSVLGQEGKRHGGGGGGAVVRILR